MTAPDSSAGDVGPVRTPERLRIAVLTYQRPDGIRTVLERLLHQARTVVAHDIAVDILVVDNDPAASARELVSGVASTSGDVRVEYAHEPTPGIAAARNRALNESSDFDLLVFIDDDERPTDRWLVSLLETYRHHRCAAVVGPVVSEFEVPPHAWIVAGEFFTRRRMPTGSPVQVAATNNLLLDLRHVRRLGLQFDLAFGLAGGEDTMFTMALHRGGGTMIWCDEAVVIDVVPTSRLTRQWVVRRRFSSGNGWSLIRLAQATSAVERGRLRVTCSVSGLLRLAGGLARFLLGLTRRSLRDQANGVKTMARGAGMLVGAWGYSYQEYGRRTPRTAGRNRLQRVWARAMARR